MSQLAMSVRSHGSAAVLVRIDQWRQGFRAFQSSSDSVNFFSVDAGNLLWISILSGMTANDCLPENSAPGATPAPYHAAHEHLADLLQLHDLRLKCLIARRRAPQPADILGFAAISEPEVQRLLDPQPPREASSIHDLQQLQLHIEARVEQSVAHGVHLPMVALARCFGLSRREIDLLLPALAVELDRRYERIYGFLHDDMSRRLASPGLALSLCCHGTDEQWSARALLSPQAPLRQSRLLQIAEESAVPWLSRSMRMDERIVSFLVGDMSIDSRIAHCLAPLDAGIESFDDAPEPEGPAESIVRLVRWAADPQGNKRPLIYLHGARHGSADRLVSSVARKIDVPVITVDCERLAGPGVDFDEALLLLFREALLRQAALYFRRVDRVFEPPSGAARHGALLRRAQEMGSVVFASGEQSWSWPLPAEPIVLRALELQLDGFPEQLHAWQVLTGNAFAEADLHRLISLHPLSVSAIRDVWRVAQGIAAANDDGATATLEQVRQACRTYAGTPVSALARRIEPRHRWGDLILPAGQLEQLRAICSQARHSSIVYGAWCFDRKLSLGKGLNALFCGPPGTGKTMAAEVIAAQLGVEILKIDLSQIVSKYIGETEKNLRQLFEQAAGAHAILFFDEADALLGKRSDVKDAHDRYANTETAYLLQKMEEYPGITILATNLRQNMDAAFTRRMRFIVDFPLPEEQDRLRIWQSVWPLEVPLALDVDMPALARQFRLSGGSIRNVALSAAFLAAEQGQAVSMQHLMRATRRELQKIGRLVNDDDVRRQGSGQ
jgi:ATPase family associated with various cellular activities (AAA)